MRFELDENLDVRLTRVFEERGLDVSSVFGQRLSGRPDEEVLRAAHGEDRTLVTLDLDFSNPLRFPVAGTPGILVIRVRRPLLSLIESTLRQAIARLVTEEVRGKLWIVEPGRIREHAPDPFPPD